MRNAPAPDVEQLLDTVVDLVEQARALPMSASCVVNRAELLGLLDDVRAALPAALAQAEQVLLERRALVTEAESEAAALLDRAAQEQERLVAATSVFTRAQAEADRLLEQARGDAAAMRAQTEDYVDAKLANFEVVLSKTLATVERGRARLSQSDLHDFEGSVGPPEPGED